MKAFLSHSSKDKHFVRQIADRLGPALCEYDEYTFEFILNSQAIRQALARCDLFAFFLSANSIASNFVAEELRTALDFRAQGSVKSVLIVALDETSYRVLPEWMQAINIVTRLSSPNTCARRIEGDLYALEAEKDKRKEFYEPRDEEAALRRALSKPPGVAPVAVHVVGHSGIGRRTFITRSLMALYPRQVQTTVHITVNRYEGANELYRRLYDYFVVSTIDDKIKAFEEFAGNSEEQQIEKLSEIFTQTIVDEVLVIIEDGGGVYADEGTYQPFFTGILQQLRGAIRPIFCVAQTRMMPLRHQEQNTAGYHTYLSPLSEEKVTELISFNLNGEGIDFSNTQLDAIVNLVDGYPLNVKLAVKVIKAHGIDAFVADPSLLIEWKRRRAEDFLARIEFNKLETEVLALLSDFKYLTFDFLKDNVSASAAELGASLRKLEEFCCIERRGSLYIMPSPIQDGVGQDKRLKKTNKWRGEIALRILETISQYKGDEEIAVPLLEAAARAAVVTGKYSGIASALILPSHFLTLARDAYDDGRAKDSLDFCKKAFALRTRLSSDGTIEVLRLWGISAIRMNNQEEFDFALIELEKFRTRKIARRHCFFLRGFKYRLQKRYDDAEREFLKAHKLARKNLSINRELASLYRYRGEYVEGESYAREAYSERPTNPFIIDVLLECLLGKASLDMVVDHQEIENLFVELQRYGDVPGSSFYQARRAQDLFRLKRKSDALDAVNTAINRTPEFLPVYFLRAEIRLSLQDKVGARADLKKINELLTKKGGFSEEEEGGAIELEIRILIEERQYRSAKDKLTRSQFLPNRAKARLSKSLAKAVSFDPDQADAETRKWSLRQLT